ncbi:MAG: hypothetical protein AMXMBFR84_25530 [Candidatus Hydrogenedentota bacterium]
MTDLIRILLVEDNPDDAGLLREYIGEISRTRYSVDVADRMSDAASMLADREFDVVLLDLSLPDSHGLQTLERMRAINGLMPIVIMTGLNDESIAHQAARGGAQDYLVKGRVDPEIIDRTIGYAMERARTEAELRKHRDHLEELVALRTADLQKKNQQLSREIEHRERAEQRLTRLATAIECAAEAIVVTSADGTIEYVNPAFVNMTGYAEGVAQGNNLRILKSGQHSDEFYREFYDCITSGAVWHGQFINKTKAGEFYTCDTTVSSVCDRYQRITGYVVLQRDVTEELRMRDQLNRTQRLDSVGQLVGGIAHDFNNVLQAILGYAVLSMDEVDEESDLHANLTGIRDAAERAAGLTRQLLAFSRRQLLQREPCALNSIINSMLDMLRRVISEDISLEFIPGHNLGTVEADAGQLEQVLLNLCINARDASPRGGRICIETENVLINGSYMESHPWARPGRFILLSVSDTGTGMAPEVAAHVFEPFFTTKGEGKGTGLGLATVYGIVKQHDGFIHCYSELGKGTIFKIYLPSSERLAVAVDRKVESAAVGGPETILVVEDNKVLRELAKTILERSGYTVIAAGNGTEALSIIDSDETISLIVSDIVMPKLSGMDLYQRLRERDRNIPMLLCSGYSSRVVASDIKPGKDIDWIQKPYDRDQLLKKVRTLLNRA